MNKSGISWPTQGGDPLWTFNPVTGCKRGCSFCYAAKIHKRFYKNPFSEIVIHPDRFEDSGLNDKKHRTIFVGSMSDIDYWPSGIIGEIIELCEEYKNHTFMFLSKNSMAYSGYKFPLNCILGITMIGTETVNCQHEKILEMYKHPRRFISFEPIMGELKIDISNTFEWVIVGAMTGTGSHNFKPRSEWLNSIINNVSPDKIWWKRNIKK